MKKLATIILAVALGLSLVSCGGGDDGPSTPQTPQTPSTPDTPNTPNTGGEDPSTPDEPQTPTYPTFAAPEWENEARGVENRYDNDMTVYVVLPADLAQSETSGDQIAVFCGSECRGVAYREQLAADKYVWIAMVHGNDGESLTFKYYSATSRHLYQTTAAIPFQGDTQYGNADAPETLSLTIVTEK